MLSKTIKDAESLGERLKKRREALNITAQEVAVRIQIPIKYIIALEEDQYDVFSAKVYALGYVKKILDILTFEDKENFLNEFKNEWDINTFHNKKRPIPIPENRGNKPLITSVRLGLGIGGILFLLSIAFLGVRITKFVGTPSLRVDKPEDQATFFQPVVTVTGKTEKESHLTVNGRELTIDELGNFSQEIELGAGLNALEFIAQNRFGKTAKVIRYVLVR